MLIAASSRACVRVSPTSTTLRGAVVSVCCVGGQDARCWGRTASAVIISCTAGSIQGAAALRITVAKAGRVSRDRPLVSVSAA